MNLSENKKTKSYETKYEVLSKGAHIARCIGVVELGPVPSNFSPNPVPKVLFIFEIEDEEVFYEGKNQPKIISAQVPISTHPKSTLRSWLDPWIGTCDDSFKGEEGFDLYQACLDRPCILNISHEPRKSGNGVFDKISGVTAMLPGIEIKKRYNDLVSFELPGYDPEDLPEYEISNCLNRVKKLTDWYNVREKVMHTLTVELFRAYASHGGKNEAQE